MVGNMFVSGDEGNPKVEQVLLPYKKHVLFLFVIINFENR